MNNGRSEEKGTTSGWISSEENSVLIYIVLCSVMLRYNGWSPYLLINLFIRFTFCYSCLFIVRVIMMHSCLRHLNYLMLKLQYTFGFLNIIGVYTTWSHRKVDTTSRHVMVEFQGITRNLKHILPLLFFWALFFSLPRLC